MVQPNCRIMYSVHLTHTSHEEDLTLNIISCVFVFLLDCGGSDRLHFAQLVIQCCHQPVHTAVSLIPAGEVTMFSGLSPPHRAASVEDKKKMNGKIGAVCDNNYNYTHECGGCVCSLSLCQMSLSSVGWVWAPACGLLAHQQLSMGNPEKGMWHNTYMELFCLCFHIIIRTSYSAAKNETCCCFNRWSCCVLIPSPWLLEPSPCCVWQHLWYVLAL